MYNDKNGTESMKKKKRDKRKSVINSKLHMIYV